MTWDQELRDPEPEKYHELANTVEDNINDLLKSDKARADFTDSVEHFKKLSVVVDFKVNYVIKEAYIDIPFKFTNSNQIQTKFSEQQFSVP